MPSFRKDFAHAKWTPHRNPLQRFNIPRKLFEAIKRSTSCAFPVPLSSGSWRTENSLGSWFVINDVVLNTGTRHTGMPRQDLRALENASSRVN